MLVGNVALQECPKPCLKGQFELLGDREDNLKKKLEFQTKETSGRTLQDIGPSLTLNNTTLSLGSCRVFLRAHHHVRVELRKIGSRACGSKEGLA